MVMNDIMLNNLSNFLTADELSYMYNKYNSKKERTDSEVASIMGITLREVKSIGNSANRVTGRWFLKRGRV